ncbi:MAG TPA: tetratricopeptide repeat protein [Kofleriaceae bacterium]|nr:tetratricopeptide repeat protein [Kofleriaceae bacterium]
MTDLPAPKRTSALGPLPSIAAPPRPAPAAAKPAPRSGLAAALDPELPAPKVTRSAQPAGIDFDEPPRDATRGGVNGPAAPGPTAADGGVADLPAPKRPAARPAAPDAVPGEIVDLPAPKLDRNEADLLAPKPNARRAIPDLPAPKDPAKIAARAVKDPATRPTITDPPVPEAAARAAGAGPMLPDLPTPRPPDAGARSAGADLLAPKGFFDDIPYPASRGRADLPAPKGFFDDLPTVKSNPTKDQANLPAPKGFFEDLPTVKSSPTKDQADLPAPKGFFDDIPGLPNASRPEVPAPKGYFDDIPGLPRTAKPEVPAPKGFFDDIPGLPSSPKPEAPAPKGYFDDVPGLPSSSKPEAPAPKGFFDDLPQPATAASRDAAALELETGPELELESLPPSTRVPSSAPSGTPSSVPAAPPRASGAFDELDLARPAAAPVRFDPPARTSAPRPAQLDARIADPGPVLELESPRPGAAPPVARRPSKNEQAAAPAADRQPRRRLLIALAAVVVLAVGGFVLYRRHVAAEQRHAVIGEQLALAHKAYAATDARHWQRAAAAARQVVELDDANPDGLGIGAEALLASALDDGTGAPSKIAQAHQMLDTANTRGISTPTLARARALAQLAAHQPDAALAQLQPLAGKSPDDGALALYLGWARAERGDAAGAIQAYTQAMAAPGAKPSALYGRGNAKLDLADLDGARADFAAVLELAKDHIGAQVGLAAAQPPAAAQRREADLLAILARKDIATADPRAVARAWTLAGDAAMRAGRYDIARERFRKALAINPQSLAAITELADTELRDGKTAAAAELTAKVLSVSKDHVAAQLVQSEIEVKQRRYPLAGQRLDALEARTPPLAPLELARLQLVRGKLAEAQGDGQGAADAYVKGAQAARDLDLDPMVAAIGKLSALTRAALTDHDPPRAAALRKRTDELLGNFTEQAERDPLLALTLGIGYLQAGSPDKAEPWLRRAADARPKDAEARFQLGRALLQTDKAQDALEALRAAAGLDPARLDIAAELARSYEVLQRNTDAAALYTKLIAGPDPGVELRARAGRFFARTGAPDKAAEQGAQILAVDPRDPAGLYLKGEGLLAGGKLIEARQLLQRAVEADRDPQYLDALGRAAEAIGQTGDREAQEAALRIYGETAEAAPTLVNPLVGQARLYLLRHEAAKAVPPLSAAVRLDPHSAEILSLLGAAYQDSQRPADARRWLTEAVKLAPSADAYWRLAQLERDANRGPQALAALSSATRLAGEAETRTGKPVPWLTDALYLQGRVHLDLRNEPAARAAWQLYLARNPPASAQLTEVKQLLATTLHR